MSEKPERVWVAINHGLKYPYHVGMATDYKWSKDSHEYVRADIHDAEVARLRQERNKLARFFKMVSDDTDELDAENVRVICENARLREALRQMQCTCLTGPHAPSVLDGTMCPRCVALKEADDE